VPKAGPVTEHAAGVGIAAVIGVLLALDIVVSIRERLGGRT
jgi:hypothetical protein